MIEPIPALYYARKVRNGLHTTNLALVWLSNKSIRTILPTFDTYVLMSYTHTETRLVLAGRTTH